MSRYDVVSVDQLDRIPVKGAGIMWRPVRRRFGITAYGVNAYTAEPGETVVENHTESSLGHEELYVVVSGRARFELDDETVDAPAGTLVFIGEPGVRRHAVAEEPGTTVLAVGGRPGVHDTSPWEYFFAAYTYADEGDLDKGIAELHAGLADLPDHPVLNYHLACLECRAGRLDDAEAHIRLALDARPELGKWAAEDEDLAPIRDRLDVSGSGEAAPTNG
jgi:quercetin dioxygenase-like cupin family protein